MARNRSSAVMPGRMLPASSAARSSSSAASVTGVCPGFCGFPGALVAWRIASARPALVIANRALREWMDRLARFAMAKAGLAEAIRQVTTGPGSPAKPGHSAVTDAAELLLRACEEAGTIRPGVTAEDFFLAIGGLWQIDPAGDWQPRAAWLLDLVMDGLRAGAPGR